MATITKQLVHTNATVQITIKGKVIGFGTNVTVTEEFGTQPVPKGIGSIMPAEHVHTSWSSTISMSKFFLRNDLIKEAGFGASAERILNQETVDIKFVDKVTGENISTYHDCTLVNRNFNLTNNGIMGRDATWNALEVTSKDDIR